MEKVYNMTESREWKGHRSLRDQLERAALSVSNNIAEGFERGTTKELLAFLYIARGSAGEVRSMLCFIEQREGFSHLKSQISGLKSISESCSRLRYAPGLIICRIQRSRGRDTSTENQGLNTIRKGMQKILKMSC
ncbi:MAG: four helix bundle protein [Deltaproteobacteria bacterium]|nr:four helix bundle protein [Deltaproteobacteria bacterium]